MTVPSALSGLVAAVDIVDLTTPPALHDLRSGWLDAAVRAT